MTSEPCPYCQQTVQDVLAILERAYGGKGGASTGGVSPARATPGFRTGGDTGLSGSANLERSAPANSGGVVFPQPGATSGTSPSPPGSFIHPLPCSVAECTERVELPYKRRDGTPCNWSLQRRYMCKRHANEAFRMGNTAMDTVNR